MRKIYKIKPSSLTSFGTKCDHCLWLGMNTGWNQRSLNLAMYSTLSRHIERKLQGKPTEKCLPELGTGGKVIESGGLVSSGKLPLKANSDFYLAGEFDHLAQLADSSYAVIDDKTSASKPDNLLPKKQAETYAFQLNAYSYCLENPASTGWLEEIRTSRTHVSSLRNVPKAQDARSKIRITRLGLNNFCMSQAILRANASFTFSTKRVWAEVAKDYEGLLSLCEDIARIVLRRRPPPPSSTCTFCSDFDRHAEYRQKQ